MKRIATLVENGRVIGLVHGPDVTSQSITVHGHVWWFDFDEYMGPLWTRKDGTALKNQDPPKAVWDEWQKWFNARKTQ